jgi:hypothetical protein
VSESDGGGGGSCLGLLVFIIALWAVCCGVTYDSKHYELECSADRGVEIDTTVWP